MPVPNSDQGRANLANNSSNSHGNKQRIDFYPNLDSIDPKYPQSPVGNHDGSTWDTETDHILSYFLGGDGGGIPHGESGFLSVPHPLGRESRNVASRDDDSEHMHLPPTPAVQFYSHVSSSHDHRHHPPHRYLKPSAAYDGSKRKESGSLSTGITSMEIDNEGENDRVSKTSASGSRAMVPSLPCGNPLFEQHQQIFQPKNDMNHHELSRRILSFGSENPSPISPAAMIGLANENLLLPIPSPNGSGSCNLDKIGSKEARAMSSSSQQLESHQQPPSPSSLLGIFSMNHHENRLLPPEKLLEVFPKRNSDTMATSSESRSQVIGASASIPIHVTNSNANGYQGANPSGADGQLSQPQQLHLNPAPILPNPPAASIHQHILYANHAEFAAAILNRHHGLLNTVPQVESEEKRAKRLERNRESARKSRRKKKERLLTLGAQVNQLHNEIEIERRKHINAMVPVMHRYRLEDIHNHMQMLEAGEIDYDSISDRTCVVIQQSGPNSRIMRSVLDFQYTSLKLLTLPTYQKMLLWFTLLEESYFTAGKDEYAKRPPSTVKPTGKQTARPSPNASTSKNLSSKQIGEDLFNESKDDNGASKGKKKRDKENDADRPNVTSNAYDGARTWPLFSFELRFSVDQEERFIATHKQVRNSSSIKYRLSDGKRSDTLENNRSLMATAVNTAESLNKAVGSLSHVISRREDQTFARILKPEQLLHFQSWLDNPNNRSRCRSKITKVQAPLQASSVQSNASASSDNDMELSLCGSKEASLQDICRRLNQVLHISQR